MLRPSGVWAVRVGIAPGTANTIHRGEFLAALLCCGLGLVIVAAMRGDLIFAVAAIAVLSPRVGVANYNGIGGLACHDVLPNGFGLSQVLPC